MPPRINDEPEYGVPMDLAPMLPPVHFPAACRFANVPPCEALLNAAVPLATELDEVKYILSVMVVAGSRLKLVQEGFSRGEFAIFEFGREDLTSYIEHYGSDLAQAGGLFVLRLGFPGAHVGDPEYRRVLSLATTWYRYLDGVAERLLDVIQRHFPA